MSGCRCSSVNVQMLARGPEDLAAVVAQVRAAVADGALRAAAMPANLAIAGQPVLAALDLEQPWPDVLQYRFECPDCGRQYELSVDSYHGSGAVWRPLRAAS